MWYVCNSASMSSYVYLSLSFVSLFVVLYNSEYITPDLCLIACFFLSLPVIIIIIVTFSFIHKHMMTRPHQVICHGYIMNSLIPSLSISFFLHRSPSLSPQMQTLFSYHSPLSVSLPNRTSLSRSSRPYTIEPMTTRSPIDRIHGRLCFHWCAV